MRTKLSSLLTLLLLVLTTSCNFTESIEIKEDGSGTMNFGMDGSQIMAMAGDEIAKEGQEERIDSTFSFKDLFAAKKDSIAKLPLDQQEKLKRLENMTVKMLMDSKTSEFKIDMITNFKNASELKDMMNNLNEIKNMNKKEYAGADKSPFESKALVNYSYDGKKFIRKVTLPADMEAVSDSLAMYMEVFEGSSYVLSYKFPKKIKSVSNKAAVISDDKKSLTLGFTLSEYYTDPKSMNLEVTFEK